MQDIVARHLADYGRLDSIGDKVSIHLNDTHPALAVPELLRSLIDLHGMSWDVAMVQCQKVMSYTNHTLMPEALETWPVPMLEHWLPLPPEALPRRRDAGAACLGDRRER